MPLENVVDNLRDGYSQLENGSLCQVNKLHEERRDDYALQNQWFYTADGHGYFLRENGGVDWAITQEEENLVLRHIGDKVNSSYDQLRLKNNFLPDNSEAEAAKGAEGTVVVNMDKLRLSGIEKEYKFLQIRTEDGFVKVGDEYKHPNKEEQKAIQRLGYNAKTRKMLRESDHKIAETRICVLNPDYVAGELECYDNNSLWRASWLNVFNFNSDFYANDRNINGNFRLRGVYREASVSEPSAPAGADAQKLVTLPSMEQVLATSRQYVPECGWTAFQANLGKLYKK